MNNIYNIFTVIIFNLLMGLTQRLFKDNTGSNSSTKHSIFLDMEQYKLLLPQCIFYKENYQALRKLKGDS